MLERSGLEGVRDVGQVGPFLVVSIKQHDAGQVMQIADYVMTGFADRPPRFLVVVDDIDPTDRPLVEWAIATRVDPATQVHIQRDPVVQCDQSCRAHAGQAQHRGLHARHDDHRCLQTVPLAGALGQHVHNQRHQRGSTREDRSPMGGSARFEPSWVRERLRFRPPRPVGRWCHYT
ncbi:hypothetical protein [Pseudonocardia thermophila]|uniref:hypothetical protein n=1 Tax=Pseudonocardia thermophila TaxID=1848 RepID=UPI003CD0D150